MLSAVTQWEEEFDPMLVPQPRLERTDTQPVQDESEEVPDISNNAGPLKK
jgi:hypothetical protein